ncbi:ATP-binding protein [Streptococcus zalophi]|uniref:ATP-binding protein n=1 Tax=Streptococcus zalophi TaxID=640031 RepID=UPI00215D5325|nr:ATP-binding protein [Streptococcus zalophi]MCR8967311.1 ATP-binding protein [Streptococcus zalophi]
MENIKTFLNSTEDEFHDFKQQWHRDNSELVRDILNFVNTVHHEDCYIIFGVTDNFEIVGVQEDENRKNTETLSDLLHKLYLSTNSQIKIKVETQTIDDKEIDILTIFNSDFVPVYLTKDYKPKGSKGLNAGLIYARNSAINTPRNESASFDVLNALFRKHNKLDVSIQVQYNKVLTDYNYWSYIENEEGSFFIYNLNPDFYMRLSQDTQSRYKVEAYSMSQVDFRISWYRLELRYRSLIIDERLLNFIDGARALVPSPHLSSLGTAIQGVSYYYFYKDSLDYILLGFLNKVYPISDLYAVNEFKNSIIIYDTKDDKNRTHTRILNKISESQIREIINYTDEEFESMYNHIITRFPGFSTGEIGYLLKQQKTTQLIKDFINEEMEHGKI